MFVPRTVEKYKSDGYVDDIWSVYGRYMIDIWLMYGYVWLVYGKDMVLIWLVYTISSGDHDGS